MTFHSSEELSLELYSILVQHYEDHNSNWFIRWLYQDGIHMKLDHKDMMNSTHYKVPVEVLTDHFFKESRELWEESKGKTQN